MRALFCVLALALLVGCQPKAAAVASVTVGGSSSALARFGGLQESFRLTDGGVDLKTEAWNSETAIQRLKDGSLDIALVSGPVAASAGLVATSLGREPVAVVVHPANRVDDLTSEQVGRIFSGRTQDWSEVGGRPGAIQAVSREAGSGTRAVFLAFFLDKSHLAGTVRIFPSPESVVGFVAETPSAIGYASLSTLSGKVKAVKLDGLSVDSARYKLIQTYLGVTSAQPTAAAVGLMEFLGKHGSP